jgi:hypothetical protein
MENNISKSHNKIGRSGSERRLALTSTSGTGAYPTVTYVKYFRRTSRDVGDWKTIGQFGRGWINVGITFEAELNDLHRQSPTLRWVREIRAEPGTDVSL